MFKRLLRFAARKNSSKRHGDTGHTHCKLASFEALESRIMLNGDSFTITGSVGYTFGANATSRPVRDIEVRLVTEETATGVGAVSVELAVTASGPNGTFTLNYTPTYGIPEAYIQIGPDHASGLFGFDGLQDLGLIHQGIQVAGPFAITLGGSLTVNYLAAGPAAAQKAHQLFVYDAFVTMHNFYQQILSDPSLDAEALVRLDIDYPDSANQFNRGGLLFDPWIDVAPLGHANEARWLTVAEEYSHYLQWLNDIPLPAESIHDSAQNLRHLYSFDDAVQTAFPEGFALFLGYAASHEMGDDEFIHLEDLEDVSAIGAGVAFHPGEDNELAIAAALWDFYDDPPSETTDEVGYDGFSKDETQLTFGGKTGLEAIWELVKQQQPASFKDFWKAVLNQESSPNKLIEYGAILQSTRMAAAPIDAPPLFPRMRFLVPKTSGGDTSLNEFALRIVNTTSDETVLRYEFKREDDSVKKVGDTTRYVTYEVDLEDVEWQPHTTGQDTSEKDEFVWLMESGYEPDDGSVSATPHYWSDALPLDMVAYWPLDDGGGGVVLDVLGNHQGQIVNFNEFSFPVQNVEWVEEGAFGGGLSLLGTQGTGVEPAKIEVQDADDLDVNVGSFSVSGWFRADTEDILGEQYRAVRLAEKVQRSDVVVDEETGFTLEERLGYQLRVENEAVVARLWGGGVGADALLQEISAEVPTEGFDFMIGDDTVFVPNENSEPKWHHVVWNIDETGASELFLDGAPVGQADSLGQIDFSNDNPLWIGSAVIYAFDDMDETAYDTATIDDVRIYDRPLTHEEIIELGNHAPTINNTQNLSQTTTSQSGQNGAGFPVSDLVSAIADFDSGALGLRGVAITGMDDSIGTLEYLYDDDPTDAVDAVWRDVGEVGIDSALLLPADDSTRLRMNLYEPFVGNLEDVIDFVAWDQTTGEAGQFADVTHRGDSSAFSEEIAGVDLIVTPGTDDPAVVSTVAAGTLDGPTTALSASGGSLTSWSGQGSQGWGSYAQLYSSDGQPVGSEIFTSGGGSTSVDIVDSDGSFVVASNYGTSVRLQRYSSSGDPLSDILLSTANGVAGTPSIAVDDVTGQSAVAWSEFAPEGDSMVAYLQRFDAGGMPDGERIELNGGVSAVSVLHPVVAMQPGGGFTAAWIEDYGEGSGRWIVVQQFDAVGVPVGMGQWIAGDVGQWFSLAADSNGDAVILWETQAVIDNSNEIRGQRMAADGSFGNDYFVAYWFDGLRHPSVALDDYGRFGAAWEVLDENGTSVGIDAVAPSSLELQKEQLIGGRSACGRSAMHAHLALCA